MNIRTLTCIGCPLGCAIRVEMEGHKILRVTGNTCSRGDAYARKEVTHPTRTVTSTVSVRNGELPVVSIKTEQDVPKEKIMAVMAALENIMVTAPVHIGDILLENVADTNVNIVATKNVEELTSS